MDKEGWTRCFVYPLKPGTVYEFRVKGRDVNGIESVWSGTVSAKTDAKTTAIGAYGAAHDLRENMGNVAACEESLKSTYAISSRGGKNAF